MRIITVVLGTLLFALGFIALILFVPSLVDSVNSVITPEEGVTRAHNVGRLLVDVLILLVLFWLMRVGRRWLRGKDARGVIHGPARAPEGNE